MDYDTIITNYARVYLQFNYNHIRNDIITILGIESVLKMKNTVESHIVFSK